MATPTGETSGFRWRPDRQALADRWLTIRVVASASPVLTALVGICIVVGALLPVAFTLATGAAVGSVEAAVRGGLSSDAGRRLLTAVVIVGALFALEQSLAPVREGVIDLLARQFRRVIFRRTAAATLVPPTVAHLEDPSFKDAVAKVDQVGYLGPRAAVQGLAGQATRRLAALASLVLVARLTPLVGALLLVALIHEQRRYRDAHHQLTATIFHGTQQLRRSNYLLSIATTPEAAKEVRVFGLPQWVVQEYRNAWFDVMRKLWAARQHNWPNACKGTLPVLVLVLVAIASVAERAASGEVSIGALAVYIPALIASLALGGVSDYDAYVAEGTRVVRSLLEVEATIENAASLQLAGDRPADGLPREAIRFEHVRFRYAGQDTDVFADLDLTIPAGKSLAIVGLNGAGKTTLVKLLARLYDPTEGRVTADGVDLRELDARAWQRRVAAIFQDFTRFSLSAEANVGFGAVERQHDRAAVEDAARAADVLDVVAGLPSGWDTILSRQWEGGADLSGGQWQRIALARALMAARSGAGVLVLDEPTAQLDVRAEAAFYERFLDMTAGKTTIVISHRFSTVRRADRIVVLEHGAIVEEGTHDELLAAGGRYATMFKLQADRFADA